MESKRPAEVPQLALFLGQAGADAHITPGQSIRGGDQGIHPPQDEPVGKNW